MIVCRVDADDERLGRLFRLIRGRVGRTQIQLAAAAGVPLRDLKRLEAGRAGEVSLDRIRSLFDEVDGRARLVAWWKGAAADRLLDERHAALAEGRVVVFRSRAWEPFVEVSFSEFGERGSIDIFAAQAAFHAVAVCEVKSVIGSLEETNRMLDVKVRLAPTIAFKRFGWRPRIVGRILILPRDGTVRRIVDAHAATMHTLYPHGGREIRAWLRSPNFPLSAIWFAPDGPNGPTIRG